MVGQVDSPAHLQEALLTGVGPKYATGRWFFITTSGALSLFPFCGLDVVDPSGVFLGQNLQTGNAHPLRRVREGELQSGHDGA